MSRLGVDAFDPETDITEELGEESIFIRGQEDPHQLEATIRNTINS
jgi:hypothetical protein